MAKLPNNTSVTPSELLDEAFTSFPRRKFLPPSVQAEAENDAPLSIGYGQTNSQPSLVRQMLEWLAVRSGDKVLDVGSGSGWTTALLSHLAGGAVNVFAVEKIAELVEYGKENAKAAGAKNVIFFQADDSLGLVRHAPYDRILVNASAPKLPETLTDQLAPGGKMIIPVKNDILEVTKKHSGILDVLLHEGYVFVPLIT